MDDILAKLQTMIAEQFAVDESDIRMETSFEDDLGADSVDLVELVMELEEEFDIGEIPEEELTQMKTVGDVVRYVSKNVK